MHTDEIIIIRLPRSRAEFLQLNIERMLEHTRAAATLNCNTERRTALGQRTLMLAVIDDALRGALISGSTPVTLRDRRSASLADERDVSEESGETAEAA